MQKQNISSKGKLKTILNTDVSQMKKEIENLIKLKELIKDSIEYNLLDGKTQLINGSSDNSIRSRKEHVDEVSKITKKIIKKIYQKSVDRNLQKSQSYLLNEEIAELYGEIMALSHDLGHTPFGHTGESSLNEFMESVNSKQEIEKILERRKEIFGEEYEILQGHDEEFIGNLSFEHNEQSAINFYKIVQKSSIDIKNIDINRIINGILVHSTSRVPEDRIPNDLAAQVVRQADKIEYVNRDYGEMKDCIKFDFEEDERVVEYANRTYKERIDKIIEEISMEAIQKGKIDDHMQSLEVMKKLKKVTDGCICVTDRDGKQGLVTRENTERIKELVFKLAKYYYQHPDKIPDKSYWAIKPIRTYKEEKRVVGFEKQEETLAENVIAYISSMDNQKCERTYKKLVKERIIYGKGYGIEPIRGEEIEKRKQEQYQYGVYKVASRGVQRTQKEYEAIANYENKTFMKERLTSLARENIKKVRREHEEDRKKDEELYQMMKDADKMRENLKQSKEQVENRIKKEVLGLTLDHKNVAQSVKKDFIK